MSSQEDIAPRNIGFNVLENFDMALRDSALKIAGQVNELDLRRHAFAMHRAQQVRGEHATSPSGPPPPADPASRQPELVLQYLHARRNLGLVKQHLQLVFLGHGAALDHLHEYKGVAQPWPMLPGATQAPYWLLIKMLG